jgi:hypothetical protein
LADLSLQGLESISDKLNPFWRNILLSELLPPKDEEENDIINDCPLGIF